MRYLIYARVSPRGSSWTGGETSIPDQVQACRSYALARDPDAVFDVIEDEFHSGGSTKRPGYQRILADLAAGVAPWDVLIVRHLDRLSRSLTDAIPLLRSLRDAGRGLVSVTQNLDMASPTGRAMLHIILVFAQWEREINSERTKAKMISICEAGGIPWGIPPFGYRRPGKRQNILEPDPDKAKTVRALYERYAAGESPAALCRDMGLARQQLWNILRNPIYIGTIRYGDTDYDGKHPPIIPRVLWDSVQPSVPKRRQGKARPNAQSYPYMLAGLVRCHCGKVMTAYSTHGRGGKKYYYYQCSSAPVCSTRTSAPALDAMVLEALAGCRYRDDDIARIVAAIRKVRDAERIRTDPELRALGEQQRTHTREIERIERAFLDGLVTTDNAPHWNTRLSDTRRLLAETQTHSQALVDAADGPLSHFAIAEAAAKELPHLGRLLETADDAAVRRRLVAAHVARVQWIDGGKWDIELTTGDRLAQTSRMASPRVLMLTVSAAGGAILRVA